MPEETRTTTPNLHPRDSYWIPVGDRLLHFHPAWISSNTDSWILGIVSRGYMVEFLRLLSHCFIISPLSLNPDNRDITIKALSHLLDIQAIKEVSLEQQGQGVYSIFFTVPKQNRDWRAVLDFEFLNRLIFHVETLRSITEALQPGGFLASLDLTEAYLHVSSHRQYLRFCVGSRHFQFRALLFGLCTAPWVFTKVLVNPVAHLRSRGIHVHPYLNNLLICSSLREKSILDIQETMQCHHDHGFLINLNKNSLTPSQRLEHLGMIIDNRQDSLFLTRDRMLKTKSLAEQASLLHF